MKLLYVYIIECSDKSYYTGVSNNPDRRMIEHKIGYDRDAYTYLRRPLKCVYVSEPMTPTQAISFEKQIKGWSRRKKEAIINNHWELLPGLSKKKLKEKTSEESS